MAEINDNFHANDPSVELSSDVAYRAPPTSGEHSLQYRPVLLANQCPSVHSNTTRPLSTVAVAYRSVSQTRPIYERARVSYSGG